MGSLESDNGLELLDLKDLDRLITSCTYCTVYIVGLCGWCGRVKVQVNKLVHQVSTCFDDVFYFLC